MKTRGILIGAGLTLAVGGAALSWHAMTVRISAEVRIAAIEREIHEAEKATRALRGEIDAAARAKPNPSPGGPPSNSTAKSAALSARFAALARSSNPTDPAHQASALRNFKERLMLDYYGLYRATRWSPAQIARFEEILTAHEGRDSDVRVTALADKLGANDPAIAQLRREENERFKKELGDKMGEEVVQQFDDYKGRLVERQAIGDLVGALALTANPLDASQTQQLVAMLRATGATQRNADPLAWDTLAERAVGFLDPVQLEELRARARAQKSEARLVELSRMLEREQKTK